MQNIFAAAAVAALATAAMPASAAVVTTLPGGTAVAMPVTNTFTAGPTTFGAITYTSNYRYSVIGYTNGYGFSSNGSWSGTPAMAGVNTANGAMTFTFTRPVSGVLADMNWAPGYGSPVTASIFGTSGNLLETITFDHGSGNILNPGYWGFARGSSDIGSLVLSNGYIGARDFSLTGGVPEPATWALMILGFGAVGGALRRRSAKAAVAFA